MADRLVENKGLIQKFFEEVINQRNVGNLSDFVAEDGTCGGASLAEMVSNPDPLRVADLGVAGLGGERLARLERLAPPTERPLGAPDRADVDAFRDLTEHVLQAFPDMKVNIESIIAEGDQVVVRWTATGTHSGEFLGTPATGRVVPMSNVDIFTIKDGKIVGVDAHPDAAGVLNALGHLPATPIAKAFVRGQLQ